MTRLWPPFKRPAGCDGCPRNRPGKSEGFVPGYGAERPRLLIVGEQPGTNEVQAGEPFVGKSGRELESATGDRSDTFITNIRKCNGIGKETPSERRESIQHCVRAYLHREIDHAQSAKATLAVGADALQVLTGARDIVKKHGSVWTSREAAAMRQAAAHDLIDAFTPPAVVETPHDSLVIASLHPAFAMRGQPHYKGEIRRALRRGANWARGLNTAQARAALSRNVNFNLTASSADLARWITEGEGKTFAVDIETTKDDWGRIILVGVRPLWTDAAPVMVLPWNDDTRHVMRALMNNPKIHKVGHNFSFDMRAFSMNGVPSSGHCLDTIHAGALLWPPPSSKATTRDGKSGAKWLSLAQCVLRVLDGVAYWKESEDPLQAAFYRAAFGMDNDLLRERHYCALDVLYTGWLWQAQRRLLLDNGMYRLYIECIAPAALSLLKQELRGLCVDVEERDKQRADANTLIEDREARVQKFVNDHHQRRLGLIDEAIRSLEEELAGVLSKASEVCWSDEAALEELRGLREGLPAPRQ